MKNAPSLAIVPMSKGTGATCPENRAAIGCTGKKGLFTPPAKGVYPIGDIPGYEKDICNNVDFNTIS